MQLVHALIRLLHRLLSVYKKFLLILKILLTLHCSLCLCLRRTCLFVCKPCLQMFLFLRSYLEQLLFLKASLEYQPLIFLIHLLSKSLTIRQSIFQALQLNKLVRCMLLLMQLLFQGLHAYKLCSLLL